MCREGVEVGAGGLADEEDGVVREAVRRLGRNTGEVTARADGWVLSAELFEGEADLFGGELLAGEGIRETTASLEDEIREAVDFAATKEEIGGVITAQAVRVGDDHLIYPS